MPKRTSIQLGAARLNASKKTLPDYQHPGTFFVLQPPFPSSVFFYMGERHSSPEYDKLRKENDDLQEALQSRTEKLDAMVTRVSVQSPPLAYPSCSRKFCN